MKLRVLGCSGAEFPGHSPSGFLIDGTLLLDAGTVGAALDQEEQRSIEHILVTHCHMDHVRGIPFLADNIVVSGSSQKVQVLASAEVIAAIGSHLLNGLIWPDFTRIPTPQDPVLSYREVPVEREFQVGEYTVLACRVNHPVPALGYRVTRDGTSLLYTGDTGPTQRIWELAGALDALVVEVSFPTAMEEIALMTGHLTPALLARELAKLPCPPRRVLITHLKPQYEEAISSELESLAIPGLELLQDGATYQL
ncbi:3',5'-cyclic-nucleotide phosphodiesterase [Geomonas paludis]|uniref:3',5'-cyclic-nucleotide phosphodiesterase n=1 Tax=Geomonas paludis TaxID=2740185 RepID=A0A6V8MUM0_9BACT|nr:3',5'-cyclic-nucleotide phosphodiesterase [Geomonas paludis]UPU37592.1 3',5'-cyclic-nucleotide phosphodiesterase [Geomonas paludis]GFO63876.1 cAMP phosphodiesterase class-II:metallo-beta-lactamase superfamily protein [Geomonas paludis]